MEEEDSSDRGKDEDNDDRSNYRQTREEPVARRWRPEANCCRGCGASTTAKNIQSGTVRHFDVDSQNPIVAILDPNSRRQYI